MWFRRRHREPTVRREPFWQSLPFALLTSSAVAVCLLLVNFYRADFFWYHPTPSPFEHPPDVVQAIYWNAWASAQRDEFSPVRTFAAETDCKVYLDLAAFNYSTSFPAVVSKAPGSEFSRTLAGWLKDSKNHTPKIRILFLPD